MMASGVIIDTSYLITLADRSRPNHATARKYWRHFAEEAIPIFLPTIVVSEFCIKQQIPSTLLRNCILLPFNWDDAIKAGELGFNELKNDAPDRIALKDDIKIFAQAINKEVAGIITEDSDLAKYAAKLSLLGKPHCKVVLLSQGFDAAFFNDGQRELGEDFGK